MEELGVARYTNIGGVTCYMNSILAVLQQTPLFTDYIVTGGIHDFVDKTDATLLINRLYKLFLSSLSNEGKLNPVKFRSMCADRYFIWGEHEQQDSSEFFQFLVTTVEEEMGKQVEFICGRNPHRIENINHAFDNINAVHCYQSFLKNEFSPLKKIFTGLEEMKTTCGMCRHESKTYQTFVMLQLSIPTTNPITEYDLTECLDNWIEDEKLDDDNRLTCGFCNIKSNAIKNHRFWIPPKVLVIHLKRFKKDMYGNICRKIKNKVNYPYKDLDISNYISDGSPYKDKCKYNLFGVNIHNELGSYGNINMGHYFSYVKNRLDDKWYNFNDSSYSRIRTVDDLVDENAYLLFYYREN